MNIYRNITRYKHTGLQTRVTGSQRISISLHLHVVTIVVTENSRTVNHYKIATVISFKYLGAILSSNLTW